MSITVQQVIQQLDRLAPPQLAESWDNVGLLLGSPKRKVEGVLCALDLNEAVVKEAIQKKVQLIVTHHPFIFKPFKKIDLETSQGRILEQLIKHDINLFAMHTNFDSAKDGMNDYLAEKLDLQNVSILHQTGVRKKVKVVVYVPQTHFEVVRDKMIVWNPCQVGNYSGCTFATAGEGTFCPEANAKPFVGTQGELEKVQEMKLEFMTYQDALGEMLKVLQDVHPYEEIAWDAFALENQQEAYGFGRVGMCKAQSVQALIEQVKHIFGVPYVRLIAQAHQKSQSISRIAICSGSGASVIPQAARCADVLITGDIGFHEGQSVLTSDLILIDVGHYASENIGMEKIKDYLHNHFPMLEVVRSQVNGEVFEII